MACALRITELLLIGAGWKNRKNRERERDGGGLISEGVKYS
jgi:hypothetical protein